MSPQFLFLISLSVCAAPPSQDEITQKAKEALKAWEVPGAFVLVTSKDKVLFQQGVGVRDTVSQLPITPETYFPLASCTKAFTATLIAQLQDQRILTFEDPVKKYYPDYAHPDRKLSNQVTLKDLLSHRTGVGGNDLLWYRSSLTQNEIFKRSYLLPQIGPFRESYHYSSTQVALAGHAAAKAAGKPWHQLLNTNLLTPLGVKNVYHSIKDLPGDADRATGYKLNLDGKIEQADNYVCLEPNPAGSLYLKGASLVPWLQFQLKRGIGPDGKRLVSVKSLSQTQEGITPIPWEGDLKKLNPETNSMSYGMGWAVFDYRGLEVVSHGGMIDGFKVQITLVPKSNIAIAVLSNMYDTRMNQALTNTLIDSFLALPEKNWNAIMLDVVTNARKAKKQEWEQAKAQRNNQIKPDFPIENLAGKYANPVYGGTEIKYAKAALQWNWYWSASPLEHWQGNQFLVTKGYFERQILDVQVVDNKVTAISIGDMVFTRVK